MKQSIKKSLPTLVGVIAFTAAIGSSHAQLVSAYNEAPVNSWVSDVATGKFTELDLGGAQALAADNVRGRLHMSSGAELRTLEVNSANALVTRSSRTVTDAAGIAAAGGQIFSMAFGNGVIYAYVNRSSADVQRNRGIATGFYAINPETAVATLLRLISTDFPFFQGLDFNPEDGQLYAVGGPFKAQSIFRIDPQTLQVTEVIKIPSSAYSSVSAEFDGVAVGQGKIFLTSGYSLVKIAVFDLASATFGPSLVNPNRLEQNRGGATYFPAAVGVDAMPGPPKAPFTPNVTFGEPLGPILNWSPNKEIDIASYNVYRATGGQPSINVGSAAAASPRFIDYTAGRGATHTYTVTAVDKTRLESPQSSGVSISVPGTPGQALSVANIFPSVNVNSKGTQATVVVAVVDQTGQPAASATVTVNFTGSFLETRKGLTNSQGVVTVTSSKRILGPVSFEVCVNPVTRTGSSYDPSRNAETCDRF